MPVPARRSHPTFCGEARKFGIRSEMSIPIFDGSGRRALFTFPSRERKPDPAMVADGYSVLTLGAFIDGYLQSRSDDGLICAAPSH
ncbi:autoinducer binding domain-containing protein (plasmid) [Mesorhizobium sp. AR02]|uniref:autoinducer binding domain-containing protein n=1 Tax=Mesorhizobium sp. AR02 TaxID=2865837 RepID=UPI00220A43EB|nr:autoinducer binding domain-containing protein [Mesorhizobium sp. AR02]